MIINLFFLYTSWYTKHIYQKNKYDFFSIIITNLYFWNYFEKLSR